MSWKVRDAMSERLDLVMLAGRPGVNMAELCRRFGVSRKTGYKWLKRFGEVGSEGLVDRSRRPKVSPRRTVAAVEAASLALRRANPVWGGRKIRRVLQRDAEAGSAIPAASTITGILRRGGLLERETPVPEPFKRFAAEAPNLLWQMDFKGHFALDGRTDGKGERCFPLTVLDDHSRYLLGAQACRDECEATVRARLTRVFETYGLPDAMITDNGNPWGQQNGPTRLTRLSVWLIRLGIRPLWSRPRHPPVPHRYFAQTPSTDGVWGRSSSPRSCLGERNEQSDQGRNGGHRRPQLRGRCLIEGETIKAIGPNLKGDETVDAEGAYVMPGGIDPHTHLEMPFMGTTAAETFESGTFAAASGGTTMLVDFVLPGADGSLITAVDDWDRKSQKQICIDIGYHMAITGWSEQVFDEMAEVVKRGVNTFKHFMAYKGALMVDDDEMFASFKRCAELGALPLVHAENGDVVAELQKKYMELGIIGPEGHAYSRPPEVEGEATNRAIMIADATGVPVYIVHVSCEQAHEAIRRARQKGMRVYGEPLIQHLTLDESEYFNKSWEHAARRVMSPPFRSKDHQDSLWAGLQAGSLQVVATDHCAFTTEQKKMGLRAFPPCRTARAGSRTGCRCSGPTASRPAG